MKNVVATLLVVLVVGMGVGLPTLVTQAQEVLAYQETDKDQITISPRQFIGPIIVGGDTLPDHGSVFNGVPQRGWRYIQLALESISARVFLSGYDDSIAALGCMSSSRTTGDAGAAIGAAASAAGFSVSYYNGQLAINNFFRRLARGMVKPAIIWLPGTETDNALNAAEIEALNANATTLADFINSGGGLLCHSILRSDGTAFNWLKMLLPGLRAVQLPEEIQNDLVFTIEGTAALPGVTNTLVNGGAWRNFFEGDFGEFAVLAKSTEIKDSLGNEAAVIIGSLPPPCVPPPMGLVSWWPGDGNGQDLTGGNNGTLRGGVTFATGKVGQAFRFDGTGEVIVANRPNLNPQAFTIEAWVFPTLSDGGIEIILNKEADTIEPIQYEIGVRGPGHPGVGIVPRGNLVFFIGGVRGLPNDVGGWADGGGAVPPNTWTHVALTFDERSAITYFNGQPGRTLMGLSGSVDIVSGPLRIGSRSDSYVRQDTLTRFNGLIDEVGFYNRALSAEEILAIYSSGNVGKCRVGAIPGRRESSFKACGLGSRKNNKNLGGLT